MEAKLKDLIDRLGKDIEGMPWEDKGISPAQLRHSVGFFIKAFQNDAKIIIKGVRNDKKTKNSKTTSK